MSMMSTMNTYCTTEGKKRLSPEAVQTEKGLYRYILADVLPLAGENEDAWTKIQINKGFPEEIRRQLKELGASERELDTEDAFAVCGKGDAITVCSEGERGLLYGVYEVLQQAQADDGFVPGGIRFAVPQCPFRGLKVYMPGERQLDQFYKIVDMLMYYRYNTIIIEVGGAMEYKRHPEINESWIEYCKEMSRYPQRADEVQNMFGWAKNSIHFENGDGNFLSQDTVRELVAYCRERGMEVIPEVPCLSHADYLLNAHQELSERPYDPFPDTYCPSNPDTYKLLFDVMDEVIDVFRPKVMQIGHDEFYTYGLCERCKERSAPEILAGDINRIHEYLAAHGIRLMFWAEKMLNHITSWGEGLAGAERHCRCSRNTVHDMPATYPAIDMIDKDCIAHNWYWGLSEKHDETFLSHGFTMTYGNWDPRGIINWQKRVEAGAKGAAPSHWTTLEEVTMQRNGVLISLVFGAYLLWKTDYTDEKYDALIKASMEELYLYRNRKTIAKAHLEIDHMTTIRREHVYITSAPMLLERDTVGKYIVTYRSGRTLDIPIIYGVNIMNGACNWERSRNEEYDCFNVDCSLSEVTYTTLPGLRSDGTTSFRYVVENPYPDDPIVGVQVVKTADDDGDIFLLGFAARQSFAENKDIRAGLSDVNQLRSPVI